MKIFIAGLPGSGKTTQSDMLSKDLGIPYVSMGALLRTISEEDSSLGEQVRLAVSEGELVDNKFTAEILRKELEGNKYNDGIIVDGYPRDIEQLKFFDPHYNFVFYLKISPEEGRRRLLLRHRNDDIPEVIDNRFRVQQERLEDLLNHLKSHYKFMEINGEKSIEEIHQEIMEEVKGDGS